MPRPLTGDQVDDFRQRACDVARRLFAERGYAGVTMRALATELGVSAMTPYRYFGSKDEIFAAVRLQAFDEFGRGAEEAVADQTDPVERLRALGLAYVRFARERPDAYRIMFQLDQPEPSSDADPALLTPSRSGWQPLLDAIQDGVDAGILQGDPVTLAHVAWVGLHGCVALELAGKLKLGRSFEELIEPVLESFLEGARARKAAP